MSASTYTIPVANISRFTEMTEALNRRALRLGIDPVEVAWGETFYQDVKRILPGPSVDPRAWTDGANWYITTQVPFRTATINAVPVHEEGWTFIATLHHEAPGASLVAVLPGEEVPVAYRWASNQCDHCGHNRRRNATFLIRHEADGKVMQVGRNCLRDFLPSAKRDPHSLARWAELLGAFALQLSGCEDEEWGTMLRAEWSEPLPGFLAATSLIMRHHGWRSRGKAQTVGGAATADLVMDYLVGRGDELAAWRAELGPATPEDLERAGAVVEWAEEALLNDDESLSDYEHNLSVVVRLGLVKDRHVGLAASMISAWQRAKGINEAPKPSGPPSEHLAEEGERIRLHNVEVTWTKEMEDRGWGASLLVKMLHDGHNVLTWFASGSAAWPEEGTVIDLMGTVKKHGEYKGAAETMLTRVRWVTAGGDLGKGKVAYDDQENG